MALAKMYVGPWRRCVARVQGLPPMLSVHVRRAPAVCSSSPSSLTSTGLSSSSYNTPRRFKSFHFYMNLESPEDTQRYVEEKIEQLWQDNKQDTTAYLHALLNLALSYYQAGDFIKAWEYSVYTHDKALAHNGKSALVYLTAKTCARCSAALADQYEAHVASMEELAHTSAALAPKPSVVFSANRAIAKLREDAGRYEGIATRVYRRPDMAFMRDFGATKSRRRGSSSSGTDYSDQRRGWSEDTTTVDEEYEGYYGARWRERRTRPEHVELKQQYQQRSDRAGGRWKVPK